MAGQVVQRSPVPGERPGHQRAKRNQTTDHQRQLDGQPPGARHRLAPGHPPGAVLELPAEQRRADHDADQAGKEHEREQQLIGCAPEPADEVADDLLAAVARRAEGGASGQAVVGKLGSHRAADQDQERYQGAAQRQAGKASLRCCRQVTQIIATPPLPKELTAAPPAVRCRIPLRPGAAGKPAPAARSPAGAPAKGSGTVGWPGSTRTSTVECRSLSVRCATRLSSASSPNRGPVSSRCSAIRSSTGPANCTRPAVSTTTQSQIRSSSLTTCEETRTVSPVSATAAISVCMNSIRATGSRLATGSSSTSSGARLASAMASAT